MATQQLLEPTTRPTATTYARGEQPKCANEFTRDGETRSCNHPTSFHRWRPGQAERPCTAMGCRCVDLVLRGDE